MVTQKDVAALAGVSFITVSRVVNGEQNVKETTRKKVLAAIEQLGYAPSFAGQVLNSGRCNTIAVLTPISLEVSARSFYLMRVLSGIEECCRKRNVDMIVGTVPEVDDGIPYDYLRPFKQKKVDGIVYIGLRKIPPEMLEELQRRQLPCVVVGDRPQAACLSWVDTDNRQAEYETVRRLWNLGHRRIAFVGLEQGLYNANISDREQGFVAALRELGADYEPAGCLLRTGYDAGGLDAQVAALLARTPGGERPTVFACASDFMVPQTVRGICAAGLSVPEDVGVVGFDGFINDSYFPLQVATNVQPLCRMGMQAAEILFAHIQEPGLARQTAVLPVTFEPHDSLRAV